MEILNLATSFILWVLGNVSKMLGFGINPIGLFFSGMILILAFMVLIPVGKFFIKAAF